MANGEVTTVLGSITASSDAVESESRQMQAVLNKVLQKNLQKFLLQIFLKSLIKLFYCFPRTPSKIGLANLGEAKARLGKNWARFGVLG
jgi:hypothetical protein